MGSNTMAYIIRQVKSSSIVKRCNSIVLSWLLNFVPENLFLGQIVYDNAVEVWAELKEAYDKLDGSIIDEIMIRNDGEVLNELIEYENVKILRRERVIDSFDGDDLAFQCMIGFRKFIAYFDPFLPMNIITRKAYNTIMVDGLESTGKNLVAVVRDVYVFVGNFTYITDFVVLEDIG
ncbi:hypothetical protein Tco_0103219 [Tanacetum coccineum]